MNKDVKRQKRRDELEKSVERILPKLKRDVWAKGKSLGQPCCRLASGYLKEYLEEDGIDVRVETSDIHEYLRVEDLIVDPTIVQFFKDDGTVPPIFVGDEKELRELFKKETKWFPAQVDQIYFVRGK